VEESVSNDIGMVSSQVHVQKKEALSTKDGQTMQFSTTCYDAAKVEQGNCTRVFFPVPYRIPPKNYGPEGTNIAHVFNIYVLRSIYHLP
jgi:hypothetical protein